ncbi:nuclear transport factor 2 family protein [Streptomyces sp. NPDC059866]|uniref:nuclear transport factor 2 family protein n=1 Tax=Streptomyces sp. NPDC059866 TaxID=3346978 RepID=UPI00364A6262
MATMEQRIARSLADYCDRLDRYDVDEVLALFAPDGTYDFGFGRIFRGLDELRVLFSRVEAYRATSHHVSNIVVDPGPGGDTATARSALYAYHVRREDESEVHVWGQYHDRFVRVGDAWLVKERRLRVAAERGTRPEDGRATLYEPLPRSA